MIRLFIISYILLLVLLAFVPAYHEHIHTVTADLDTNLKILVRFLFDPIEYAYKWVVFIIVMLFAIFF